MTDRAPATYAGEKFQPLVSPESICFLVVRSWLIVEAPQRRWKPHFTETSSATMAEFLNGQCHIGLLFERIFRTLPVQKLPAK